MKPLSRIAVSLLLGLAFTSGACGGSQEADSAPAAGSRSEPAGRIRGAVRLRGSPPAPAFEPVPKDQGICGSQVPVTRLALGRDNGVKYAFVYLDGVPSSEPLRPRAVSPVEQSRCEYAPHALALPAGAQLDIVNGDPILHNVHARQMTADGLQTIFNIAQPVRGQRTLVDLPLDKPGIVALTCEAGHPWMTAHILVAAHPYVTVTGEDGGFEIANVPPGTYHIRMWHEGVRLKNIFASLQQYEYEDPYEITREVTLPAAGEVEVNFDLELRGS